MKHQKVFLIGLPGSGKTTCGQKLAQALEIPFIDLDERIVTSQGQSISSIFEMEGEDRFREIEKDQLREVISSNSQFVLATGGGTPCFHDNLEQMNCSGITIYLDTPLAEIEKRLEGDSSRPLLQKNNLKELLEKRSHFYSKAQNSVSSYAELLALLA